MIFTQGALKRGYRDLKTLYVISGLTGMTGSELARQILANGDTVIGFDNFFASSVDAISDVASSDRLHFFAYDLNRADEMAEVNALAARLRGGFGALVYINCAAIVHTEHFYHIDRTFETNVLGMKSFLDSATALRADAFINCSTSEVYSMQSWKEGGMAESDYILMASAEHSQRTSYAAGKLLTEFFMRDAVENGRIRGCSIRFANVYSPYELYPKHIIPHIFTSLIETGSVTLLENSRVNRRTFLHNIDSCASVLALASTPEALDGTVYNVATDEEVTMLELVSLIAKKLNISEPRIVFEGYRTADPERRLLNTEKLRARTSWRPRVTLDQGLDMCLEGYGRKKP